MPLSVVRPGLVLLLLLPCLVAVQVLVAAPFTVYFWCLNCILLCRLQQQSKPESCAQVQAKKTLLCVCYICWPGSPCPLLPCQPHIRALPPSARTSLSPLGVSDFACRCRRFCRCRCRSCCCGCKFYLSFNIFYGLYAAKRGVGWGWGCSQLAATHFKWLLKHFILHTKYLPCRRVCESACACECVCVSACACVCERLCMCCAHLICLITPASLIGVAAASYSQLRFKPWPKTFGIHHV